MNDDIPISHAESLHNALVDGQNEIWSPSKLPNERIVVFVHGFASRPFQYEGLLESIADSTGADIYAPKYSAGLYSDATPSSITSELADSFNKIAARYKEILFVAHSMGTAFLRDAFLKGLGSKDEPAPLKERLAEQRVRMTFLAGSSRGYKPMDWKQIVRLGFLRRWYWLTLAVIAMAWIIRSVISSYWKTAPIEWNQLGFRWISAFVGYAILICAAVSTRKELRRNFIWPFLSTAAWLLWALGGWSLAYFMSVTFSIVCTFNLGLAFARKQSDAVLMIFVVTGLGIAAPWLANHPQWAYPAFLLTLIPLFLYPMRSRLLLEHVLFGAPWITGVRVKWMEAFAEKGPNSIGLKPPPIVHLFGEEDRLVGDDDHVELHQSERTVEIALRGVTHSDFLIQAGEMIGSTTTKGAGEAKTRREKVQPNVMEAVRWAVTEEPEAIRAKMRRSEGPRVKSVGKQTEIAGFRLVEPLVESERSETSGKSLPKDEHLVFLVHGIRDFAEWQDSLATKFQVVAQMERVKLIDVVQVRYGYFSALQFLLSGERERATRSFVDLYTQTKARHPYAVCHAAAHSNGTFVVGSALQEHDYIKLQNVYLAGSVLTRSFVWPGIVGNRVRSDRAMQDWPVGVLCRMLSWVGRVPLIGFHYRLLGPGGIDGFKTLRNSNGEQVVFENAYLPGGHGEALRPKYHDEIAKFVLTGEPAISGHGLSPVQDVNGLRGRMTATLLGLAVAIAAFVLPALWGPAFAGWGILVGALTLLLVVRLGMAV